jgi:Skp family chaperone for outer membrane proteins
MSRKMAWAAVAAALACAVALPAGAALYKWTDANGRVVYSDQPPTEASIKAERLNAAAPPANPNAAKELAQKDVELKKRQADRAEAAARTEKDRAARDRRAEECSQIASSIKQLAWGQVVIYRANEKGEQVPMDEAARQKERGRLEALQKEHCA